MNLGKSILKGLKYTGLTLAAAGLTGVGAEVVNLAPILIGAGVPASIAVIAAGVAAPAIGSVIAVTVQQLLAHRETSK